jgi:hypothetical protein
LTTNLGILLMVKMDSCTVCTTKAGRIRKFCTFALQQHAPCQYVLEDERWRHGMSGHASGVCCSHAACDCYKCPSIPLSMTCNSRPLEHARPSPCAMWLIIIIDGMIGYQSSASANSLLNTRSSLST